MCRSRFEWCAAVAVALVAAAAAAQQKDSARLGDGRSDDSEPVAVLAENPIRADASAAGAAGSCRIVGDFIQFFSGDNRLRGNAYRLDTDVTLIEVQMELDIRVSTTLHFAVFRRDSVTGEWNSLTGSRQIPVDDPPGVAFYSSGPLDLELSGGADYLMAFAWGGASVGYARDVPPVDYPSATPDSFDIGQILGIVGTAVSVPIPETFDESLSASGVGAWSMILCLEPVVGACCSPSADACTDKLEVDCLLEAGAHFFGERTLCLDNVCEFGACCRPCSGLCDEDFTPQACEATDGVAFWRGASCPQDALSLCPPVTGACCKSGGTCEQLCEADCLADGGVYRGDDTTCDTNPCVGACCLESVGLGCFELTPTACEGLQGLYRGDGTTCATLPPEMECGGACCLFLGSEPVGCGNFDERSSCVDDSTFNKAYLGDGSTCPESCERLDPLNYGACCMPDGTCINMLDAATCEDDAGGHFNASVLCPELTLGTGRCATAPCCLPDGSCERLTINACGDRTGDFQSGVASCSVAVCPIGACCEGDEGRCNVTSETACDASGGTYTVDGSDCTEPALACPGSFGFGACCTQDSDCLDALTSAECAERAGDFAGVTTCDALDDDPATDCDQRGACCAQTGTCLFLTKEECEADPILGTFVGAGELCGQDLCPSGACCHEFGCTVTGETYCRRVDGLKGSYQGDGTECTINACIPSGACCINGDCAGDQTVEDCQDQGGFYRGDDSTCEGDPCVLGVCCNHGQCTNFQIAETCETGDPDVVFLAERFCFEAPCEPFGACCFATGDCVEDVSQSSCETDGGDLRQNLLCDQFECEANGACCLRDATCQNGLDQSDCDLLGGVLTPAQTCNNVTCEEIGACCLRSGECVDDVTRTECESQRGTLTADRTCGQIALCSPVGACCLAPEAELECQNDVTLADCQAAGGNYRGDESDCPAAGTACGACCSLTGCVDGVMSSECVDEDQRDDFLPGFTCAERSGEKACQPRGACCVPGGTCEVLTESDCADLAGTFDGVGTSCEQTPDLCALGACCDVFGQAGGACEVRTRIECEAILGAVFQGADTDCQDATLCAVGSCCPATGAGDCLADAVASQCADPADFRSGLPTCDSCEGRGACCTDSDVGCQILFESECTAAAARYAGNGTTCPAPQEDDLCFVGACCDALDTCTPERRIDCEQGGRSYRGAGVLCEDAPCFEIVTVAPGDCAIDPAQTSDPDGASAQGWQSLTVTFSADAGSLAIEDLLIENAPGGVSPPQMIGIVVNGAEATVDLDVPIPPGQWSCLTHVPSGTRACVGFLPADTDGNGTANPDDPAALVADLELAVPQLPAYRCDIDRSGACTPTDLLRAIDLLQGAQPYEVWNGQSLPPCPQRP